MVNTILPTPHHYFLTICATAPLSCHGFAGSALIFGFRLGFLAPCSDHQFFSNQRHSLTTFLVHHPRAIHVAESFHLSLFHHPRPVPSQFDCSFECPAPVLPSLRPSEGFSPPFQTSLSFHHRHPGQIHHESITTSSSSISPNTQVGAW